MAPLFGAARGERKEKTKKYFGARTRLGGGSLAAAGPLRLPERLVSHQRGRNGQQHTVLISESEYSAMSVLVAF